MTVEIAGDRLMAAGPEPGPGQRAAYAAPARVPWMRVFAGEPAQVREVRYWLQGLLPACEALEELLECASELCTNAITHTRSGLPGGWFGVSVLWSRTSVRVMVSDHGSPSVPAVNRPPLSEAGNDTDAGGEDALDGCEDPGGRGLLLVENMSAAWGAGGDACGRFVWFDIRWPEGLGPLEPESGRQPAELEWLRGRHPGITIWFGRQTRTWLAALPEGATPDGLIEAPSAIELDRRLEAREALALSDRQPGDPPPPAAGPVRPGRGVPRGHVRYPGRSRPAGAG